MAIEQASLISALYLVHRVSLKLYNCYANRLVRFVRFAKPAQNLHTHFMETQVLVNKQLFSCVVIEWE